MKKRLIIAGGGTGGHLYPAIAIARALHRLDPEWDIQFVGARGGLEEKIIPRENFLLHLIPIGRLNRNVGVWQQLRTVLGLPWAALKTVLLVRKLQPTVVLGVGGFASGPFLLISSLMGVPCALWEPNAYPGLANRLLAPFMKKCLVVFKEAQQHLRGRAFVQVGLPVRSAMQALPRPQNAEFHVLVFGGSQGARAVNNVVAQAVEQGWLEGVQLVHQTGAADFASISERYKGQAAHIQAFEFLHDMEKRYEWADLIICRSGASTVAEVCAVKRPAVFIPLPSAADNHQQKNAEVLVRAGAAEMILQKELTPARLLNVIEQYKSDPSRLHAMTERLEQFQYPEAAEKTAGELLKLV